MKLNYRLALALFICMVLTAKLSLSQNYVEIGTGTVSATMPVYSSWNYSWSSLIYNHNDLGTAKTITKIALNCINGPKTVTNQKIYVKLASTDVFPAANYEDPTNNGYVLVFQGNITFQTGWNEIVLSTPVAYDGVQNILIHWENRWGTTYGPNFNSTSSVINNNKNCGNDIIFPPSSQTGYLNPYPSSLTNMRFYYTSTGPGTPTNPIPADNASAVSVDTDLSWTLGSNTTSYDLYFGTDPLNLPVVVANAPCTAGVYTYTVPGLLADSLMHYWKVVAKNGAQQETSPVWKFKTEVVIDQFPYNEGFEDSTVFHTFPIASAWQVAPDISWYQYEVNANSGLLCAKSFSSVPGNFAILRSPKVLLPAGYSISYFWRNTSVNKVAGHDTTFFEISTNGGNTWLKLDTLAPATQNAAYVQRTRDLNVYAGNNFFFRFRHVTDNSGSACNVYLDDISIYLTGITPTLAVTPANQNVTSPLGTTSFTLVSNSTWTAISDQAWCTVTSSGTGNGTITANYTENTTTSQRIAHITVTVSGLSPVVVTVTQGIAAATLSVSPANQNVTSPGGTTDFTVTSTSSWTASSNQSWCTVTPSGTGNSTLTATYSENTDLAGRVADITVLVAGLSPITVTVTQEASTSFLSVTPPNQEVAFAAGTTNFSVNSNLAWTALSDASWCTVTSSGSGNGTLFATFAENTISTTRVAHVTVTGSGISPVTVTVTQQGPAATLSVTPLIQHVTYQPGVTTFAVTSNTSWTTISDASWCESTVSGTGSGVISVAYAQNETMVTRTANITVNASGATSVVLQVVQQPSYVSVDEFATDGVKIYPNPAKDFVNVLLPEVAKGAFVQLFNPCGTKLIEQNISTRAFSIDVSEFAKGNYMLRIFNGNKLTDKKIVIN